MRVPLAPSGRPSRSPQERVSSPPALASAWAGGKTAAGGKRGQAFSHAAPSEGPVSTRLLSSQILATVQGPQTTRTSGQLAANLGVLTATLVFRDLLEQLTELREALFLWLVFCSKRVRLRTGQSKTDVGRGGGAPR